MIYGEEKRLEMARSILPSSHAGWTVKRKRHFKKSNRHQVRQMLKYALANEDYEPPEWADTNMYPDRDIRHLVNDRRAGDKVRPFMRWAEEVTKDIPVEDRLSYIRSILPQNLIGQHAVSHITTMDHFQWAEHETWYKIDRPKSEDRVREQEAERLQLVEDLKDICRSGWGLARLNAHMQNGHEQCKWVLEWESYLVLETTYMRKQPQQFPVLRFYPSKTEDKGPSEAPKLHGIADIPAFLDKVWAGSNAPRWVSCEPYVEPNTIRLWNRPEAVHNGIRHDRRVNPESHPEWAGSMWGFVGSWSRGEITNP